MRVVEEKEHNRMQSPIHQAQEQMENRRTLIMLSDNVQLPHMLSQSQIVNNEASEVSSQQQICSASETETPFLLGSESEAMLYYIDVDPVPFPDIDFRNYFWIIIG